MQHAQHARVPFSLQVRPSKTSKAFWEAMSKVQDHLTDAKKVAAYNQKKEQKMRVGGADRRARAGRRAVATGACCWVGRVFMAGSGGSVHEVGHLHG